MKKLVGMSLVWSLVLVAGAETLAYWDFSSDPQGVLDCTGNFNTLTNAGVRIVDGAAEFDGVARVFRTMSSVRFAPGKAYTIEFFARSDAAGTQCLMELSPNINSYRSSCCFFLNDGFLVRTSANGFGYNGESFLSTPCGDGLWHHYAGIVNPLAKENVADQVQFYVDGVRQQHNQNFLSPVDRLDAGYCLYIGSRGNVQYPFKGAIDDIRITSGALSTNEFLKTRTTNTALNVVCHYPFDHTNPLADASGNGNALMGDGVSFADDFAHFDGASHVLNTIAPLALSTYDAVTIECFIRLRPGNTAVQLAYEYSANAGSNPGAFFLNYNERPGVGFLCSAFHSHEGVWHLDVSGEKDLDAGWHHVAMVCDRKVTGNDQCRLYIDGYPQLQEQQFTGNMTSTFGNHTLYLGSRANGSDRFDGDIDDFRISAQALQPGQFLTRRSSVHDDVVAYWDFDPRHDAFLDRSENEYRLSASGVSVSDQQAALLDGAQTAFQVKAIQFWECQDLTVEFFLRTTNSNLAVLCELGPNVSSLGGSFVVALNEDCPGGVRGAFNLTMKDAGLLSTQRMLDGNVIDGKWHHVALVYKGRDAYTKPVQVYVDGVPGEVYGNNMFYRPTRILSGNLYIGSRNNSSLRFAGELDDIRITARALTPEEFLKHRTSPWGLAIILQ